MKYKVAIFKNTTGLTATLANKIIKSASKNSEDVILESKGVEFDAKNIIDLMNFNVSYQSKIRIRCSDEFITNEIKKLLEGVE